jgi:hypothetical protein
VLEGVDVGDRVAGHGDDVGDLAGLEAAKLSSTPRYFAGTIVAERIASMTGMPASTM